MWFRPFWMGAVTRFQNSISNNVLYINKKNCQICITVWNVWDKNYCAVQTRSCKCFLSPHHATPEHYGQQKQHGHLRCSVENMGCCITVRSRGELKKLNVVQKLFWTDKKKGSEHEVWILILALGRRKGTSGSFMIGPKHIQSCKYRQIHLTLNPRVDVTADIENKTMHRDTTVQFVLHPCFCASMYTACEQSYTKILVSLECCA